VAGPECKSLRSLDAGENTNNKALKRRRYLRVLAVVTNRGSCCVKKGLLERFSEDQKRNSGWKKTVECLCVFV